jgi:hypothetical protein
MFQEKTFAGDAGESMLSRGDSLVPESVTLDEAKASGRKKRQRRHRACSGKCSALSAKSSHFISLLRTYLLHELEEATQYSVSWKDTATPAGRSWWVASISARRTEETGHGPLADWPTLTASAVQNRSGRYAGGNLTLEGLVRQLAAGQPDQENGNMTGSIPG